MKILDKLRTRAAERLAELEGQLRGMLIRMSSPFYNRESHIETVY